MNLIDIVVLIIVLIIVALLVLYFVLQKRKGKHPLNDCSCKTYSKNQLLNDYHKKYSKEVTLKKEGVKEKE